jgi:uncharacterized iron-regulated protein
MIMLCFHVVAQDNGPYIIYNSKGKKVSYAKMIKQLKTQDLVFFGELHNNPISHWIQYEMTSDLIEERSLILGAEMMEADNQKELDQYLSGQIDQKGLDSTARLWKNYKTDYKPLIDLAKDNKLPFIATNIPRPYASMVNKEGFEVLNSLSEQEKAWIAPLPFPYDAELPRYVNILEMMGGHGTPNLVKAQASKDATMGHFIVENWNEGQLFVHYNGSYHSDFHEGIVWYINQYRPGMKIMTIATVEQADIRKLNKDFMGQADFIICVDENMTKTY